MIPNLKAARLVGIVAALVSVPLVAVLWGFFGGKAGSPRDIAYVAAPFIVGAFAFGWWLVSWRAIRVPLFRGITAGAVCGVLTFLSFAATFDFWWVASPGTPFGEGFRMVGGVGLLLFGWIPLIAGAVSGWFAERKYLLHPTLPMQPAAD